MKKFLISLAAFAMLSTTVGCANGPVRNFLCDAICTQGCEAPPAEPSFGFAADAGCATGNCNHGLPTQGEIFNGGFIQGQVQGDPYINGSNFNGATINPPVFDGSSNPSFGSTIVPPASSGTLPFPAGGSGSR